MEFPETKDMNFPNKMQTERLLLQRVKENDTKLAKEVFSAVQETKKEQTLFYPFSQKDTLEDIIEFFNLDAKLWNEKKQFCYLIYNKRNNEFLGYIGLHSFTKWNKTAELDYWLKINATGNGYCSEALKEIERLAFKNGIGRLVLKIDSLNTKSNQVAQRNNYHLDGVLRQDSYIPDLKAINDSNFYSKLKSDWEKQKDFK